MNIDKICREFGITNYTINEDESIDVDGNVDLSNKKLIKLPLKFRNVSGNFYCFYNQLTSLEGGPTHVGGNFYCSDNQLTSLEGCPTHVGGYFNCSNNQLTNDWLDLTFEEIILKNKQIRREKLLEQILN